MFSLGPAGTLPFHTAAVLDGTALSAVQRRIRSRVLRLAVRHGVLTPEVAADLARWGHGSGFSLHAAVSIEAADRLGFERLLRYCARPAFASERLYWDGSDQQDAVGRQNARTSAIRPLTHPSAPGRSYRS